MLFVITYRSSEALQYNSVSITTHRTIETLRYNAVSNCEQNQSVKLFSTILFVTITHKIIETLQYNTVSNDTNN